MASFLWWIVGFYWVVSGGDALLRDAPRLYWYALTTLECPLFISICYMLYYFEMRARAHTYSFPFFYFYLHVRWEEGGVYIFAKFLEFFV